MVLLQLEGYGFAPPKQAWRHLIEHGIDVGERLESVSSPNPENAAYLRTKKLRMGHLIGDN